MRNKKAISALVATVLLVLITIAAVGMVWGAIMPIIKKNIDTSQKCNDAAIEVNTQQGFTYVSGNLVSYQISRGPSTTSELSAFQVKIIDATGNSNSTKVSTIPAPNTDKVYSLDVTTLGLTSNAKKIGIAPILKIGNTDFVCPMKEVDLKAP